MRPLLLTDEMREAARVVREHAEKPENWFRPGPSSGWAMLQGSGLRPGDKPEHIVVLPHEFKCVFSWTVAERRDGSSVVVRDLSVSVPGGSPHPVMVFEIAELFGFTRRPMGTNPFEPGLTWIVGLDQCHVPCATVVEEVTGPAVARECEDHGPRSQA